MYKCDTCGEVMEELGSYREYHDELDECPYEEMTDWDCVFCGGTFQGAKECPVCGEFYLEDESKHNWCQSCLDEYKTPDMFRLYIESDKVLLDDFCKSGWFDCWNYDSIEDRDALIELCKKQYYEFQELGKKFPSIERHLKLLMEEYTACDWPQFYDWLADESGVAA